MGVGLQTLDGAASPGAEQTTLTERVHAEQVRTVYRQTTPNAIGNVFVGLIVTVLLWSVASQRFLVSWMFALAAVNVGRLWLHYRYARAPDVPSTHYRYGRLFALGASSAGLLWGVAAVGLYPEGQPLHEGLVVVAIGGMTAGATGTLAPYPPALYGFGGLSLLPLAVRVLWIGGSVHLGMGAMILMYAVVLATSASNIHAAVMEAFRLRFFNEELLEQLARAGRDLEQYNRELEERVQERTSALDVQAQRQHAVALLGQRALEAQAEAEAISAANDIARRTLSVGDVVFLACGADDIVRVPQPSQHASAGESREFRWGNREQAMFDRGEVLALNNLDEAELPAALVSELRARNFRSAMIAAVRSPPTTHGFIAALERHAREFDEQDQTFLRTIAQVLAVAVSRDRAESALRASERKLAEMVLESPDAIFATGADGVIEALNPAAEALTGYSATQLLSKRIDALGALAPAQLDRLRAEVVSLRDEKRRGPVELQLTHKDGSLVDVELNMRRVTRLDGTTGIQATLRDIRERKSAERERDHLEAQLRQAQRLESVGRLAGGVAHDFNNLLTVIRGSLDLLRQTPPDKIGSIIEAMNAATSRATSLTRQLLAFSRQQVLQPRAVDLNAILLGLHEMLVRLLGETISIELKLSTPPARARVDPGQIEQVVMNLAVNARDAMPDGGTLTLSTAQTSLAVPGHDSRPFVQLRASDTGCGMSPDTLQHIFEPFFSTKPQGQGTGLGLATVHGIVKQSGGEVRVISNLGRGTTFDVYLPLCTEEEIKDAVVLPQGPGALRKTGETVLVVEDEPLLRETTTRILEHGGYRVLQARDAAQAADVSKAHQGRIDLLVSDVIMPGVSGAVLAEQLARERPEMVCLLVSGYAGEALHRNLVLKPGFHFMAKPFTLEQLLTRVGQILDATH